MNDHDQPDHDQRDDDPSEDYGYALAHEIPASDLAWRRPGPAHHDGGHRPAAAPQPEGDYGYDEVHDL